MPKRKKVIRKKQVKRKLNSVGPSRDGHEFHEIWVARKCLQLIMPQNDFVGLAVEGLEPQTKETASKDAEEIADVTIFYGDDCNFNDAREYRIAQFKYSVSRAETDFRASDAKKTIHKFAAAYRQKKREHGTTAVNEKLKFEIVTNRPIYEPLIQALGEIATQAKSSDEVLKQRRQVESACGLKGASLVSFAKMLSLTGLTGNLGENKDALYGQIVNLSAAPDILAKARLQGIKDLVRDKAGSKGIGRNLIKRVDVLAALGVQSVDDLLPCPSGFPEIGPVVARDQLAEVAALIPTLTRTLVLHATGGVGKTVFMQSLATMLGSEHKTVLFDCFGGGNYRAPDDSRHLPKLGLVHIANSLAVESLCDPLLPYSDNVDELIKGFRTRLNQAVSAIRAFNPKAQLFLFLDAVDNASEHARDRNEDPFPRLLIESFHYRGPVPGVQLIVSCRPHRKDKAIGDIQCEELSLRPFSFEETTKYLVDRIPNITPAEIRVAQSRSLGNPRVLEYLVISDRDLLENGEVDKVIEVDELIKARIEKALKDARNRGNREEEIRVFLAGLSKLPPPVPVADYALASGLEESAIQGFAADMWPLLEISRHGLTFRDEPTEDFIKKSYAADAEVLKTLSTNLNRIQSSSVYAAQALPWLLLSLEDREQLYNLAFDDRYPAGLTSAVGRQHIKYSRLKAAVSLAVSEKNYDHLVHFCVELSTLAATDERGIDYILDYPDLVVAAHDTDSLRRLIQVRTTWPGMRDARLAIANAVAGDKFGAEKHASNTMEWIHHYFEQDEDYQRDAGGPNRLDIAAIVLCYVVNDDFEGAKHCLSCWSKHYAFEITGVLFPLVQQALNSGALKLSSFEEFIQPTHPGLALILGTLAYVAPSETLAKSLIKAAARTCKELEKVDFGQPTYSDELVRLNHGLLKAAAVAVKWGMKTEAGDILSLLKDERPNIWTYNERHSYESLTPYLIRAALLAIVQNRQVAPQDILPADIFNLGISPDVRGKALNDEILKKLDERVEKEKAEGEKSAEYGYERKREVEKFLSTKLNPIFALTSQMHDVLLAPDGKTAEAFHKMSGKWSEHVKAERKSYGHDSDEVFLVFSYLDLLSFAIWCREDIRVDCIKAFDATLREARYVSTNKLIRLVGTFSSRPELQNIGGELASYTRKRIESEDDVSARASGFGDLARAILPASRDEAAVFFRMGLEQMDAIGSGDYDFTNELLLFASELRGDELADVDVHTLSNICELNINDAEKFPWSSFAYGFSKVSGRRVLAKISRWDDRDKVPLEYSLLPCLAALVDHDKIDPTIALSLLNLAKPAEFHTCGTKEFADILLRKNTPATRAAAAELIHQYHRNRPGAFMAETYDKLFQLAKEAGGELPKEYAHLEFASAHYKLVRSTYNANRNYRGNSDRVSRPDKTDDHRIKAEKVQALIEQTDPNDEASLAAGIDALEQIEHIYDLKQNFFDGIRAKVKYGARVAYVSSIGTFEHVGIYTKIKELQNCKSQWGESTAALEAAFKNLAPPLIQTHSDAFIQFGHLASSLLNEVSDLTDVPQHFLGMELVRIYASPEGNVPASVWIGLASLVNEKAADGEGQKALTRLLNSNAAKLSATVIDGAWDKSLAVQVDEQEIAASFIWRMLGSPVAEQRWRAAHCLRTIASFGKWQVLKLLIDRFQSTQIDAYSARELPFFFLHARLWLLIAMARIAQDFPKDISTYKPFLFHVATDEVIPHVLFRHFAGAALSACLAAGTLKLSAKERAVLSKINVTPYPVKYTEAYEGDSYYADRPEGVPEVTPAFSLEYDFDKSDVQALSNLFDVRRWELENAFTTCVRAFDSNVEGMYETAGREIPYRLRYRLNDSHHSYGYHLGWHAQFIVAGELLRTRCLLKRPYENDDPWEEWLQRSILTRGDGLWLSDGLDLTPIETRVNLLVQGTKDVELTGDNSTLMALLGITPDMSGSIAIKGHWKSTDMIDVEVTSALVPPATAAGFAETLSKDEPFQAWLPIYLTDDGGNEYSMSKKDGCVPWIAKEERSVRLDEYDPWGASCVPDRYRLAQEFNDKYSLVTKDPFKRFWFDKDGSLVLQSQAWGSNAPMEDERPDTGLRLLCDTSFLKRFLSAENKDLVILLLLRRYESRSGRHSTKYHHTMAVVHVSQSLEFNFIEGIKNKPHESKF